MADLPVDLREALASQLVGMSAERLRASVASLGEAYRSGETPTAPILAGPADVAAYAAYRMAATFSAARQALGALAASLSVKPRTLLDLGGGTGAAAWAAAAVFDTICEITVVDQVGGALMFGASLARGAASAAVRDARWTTERLAHSSPPDGSAPDAARVDLVTVSYVLGELAPADATYVVDRAMAAGSAVVIVEPGTPAGYARILAARDQMIEAGATIIAPCPHQTACPLTAGDWCHFGARVNRSALHRRVKDGELSYEDEKFSYVVAIVDGHVILEGAEPDEAGCGAVEQSATGSGAVELTAAGPGAVGRVLRRPLQRKGMVSLRLCRPDGTAAEQIVSKRHNDLYRQARATEWGETFPIG